MKGCAACSLTAATFGRSNRINTRYPLTAFGAGARSHITKGGHTRGQEGCLHAQLEPLDVRRGGIVPDLISYIAVISACEKGQQSEPAFKRFLER